MTENFYLAQLNIATLKYDIDDPRVTEFFDALDEVNSEGESTPGFIWRLKDETGSGATEIRISDNPREIVNLTVWENLDSLYNFTYSGLHVKYFKKRREWFEKSDKFSYVLWWVEKGHTPTINEALEKLRLIQTQGPSEDAFHFGKNFEPTENSST